jgi:NAD(P)-dependent dehydrogenase (short-subunit alcohol dehydrogenase family)
MTKRLEDKIAIVTGSSSGIGEGIAIRFAQEGANVVVVSNAHQEKGISVTEKLITLGSDALYVNCDFSTEEGIETLIQKVKEKYGRVDILVNNAGTQVGSPFGETTYEMLEHDMKVNAYAPFILSQRIVSLMDGKGWIVNTSSFRAVEPRSPIAGYSASKAALNNFTKSLAMALAPNIMVNAIMPGFVETENYKRFSEELKQGWLDNTLIKRFPTPEEMAEVYVLLATTPIITGTVITVDGGYSLLNR